MGGYPPPDLSPNSTSIIPECGSSIAKFRVFILSDLHEKSEIFTKSIPIRANLNGLPLNAWGGIYKLNSRIFALIMFSQTVITF